MSVPGGLSRGRRRCTSAPEGGRRAIDARAFNTTTGEIVWADSAREATSDARVYVAGAGGGAEDRRKLDSWSAPSS